MSKDIIVVEPHEDIRAILKHQLNVIDSELVVFMFHNGKEVFSWLRHHHAFYADSVGTVIVANEKLDTPAEDIVRVMKKLYPLSPVRVVVTTTSPYKEETTRTMTEAGADFVLWKPWDMKGLREAIQLP